MRKLAFILALGFLSVPASAQDNYPKAEVFGGYSYANLDLFAPFGQRNNAHGWGANVALNFGKRFGVAHIWESETNFTRFFPSRSDTGFAMGFGGGLDIHLNGRVSIRIFQADYLPVDSPLIGEWRHNARIQTGIVFRFGGSP